MREGIEAVPALVQQLYAVVGELEVHFPGRKFTPDGHLVGSIGEVLAAYHYGLDLYTASAPAHDACCPEGREVQVKAIQGRSVGLRSEPEHLLVIKLDHQGGFEDVYNGPGDLAWVAAGKMQSNGQRSISTSKLAALMERVPARARVGRAV